MTRSTGHRRIANPPRHGVSMLEAILALAILGSSLAVLSQIMGTGVDAGMEAGDLVICRMAAISKMNEVLIDTDLGISPTPVSDLEIPSIADLGDRQLLADIDVTTGTMSGLLIVRVTVRSMPVGGEIPVASMSLVRWIVDPTLDLEGLEAELAAGSS